MAENLPARAEPECGLADNSVRICVTNIDGAAPNPEEIRQPNPEEEAAAAPNPEEEVRRKRQEVFLAACEDRSLSFDFRSFDVEKQLGEGAFGRVFRVKHRRTGAILALKIVLLDDSVTYSSFVEVAMDAKEEALRIQQLQHPNIVRGVACTYARIPRLV
jgi:hypothetical protein